MRGGGKGYVWGGKGSGDGALGKVEEVKGGGRALGSLLTAAPEGKRLCPPVTLLVLAVRPGSELLDIAVRVQVFATTVEFH